MVHCKNCQYWRKIREESFVTRDLDQWPGRHGECSKINEFSFEKTKAWLYVGSSQPFNREEFDQSLITQADFGCVLGEERVEK